MQSIQIKIQHNNEIRRFAVETLSYPFLLSTIRTLFSIPEGESIITKFCDDEGDFVTFDSDEELQHACELQSTGPLRITLVTSQISTLSEKREFRPKGRGCGYGQGRGRGFGQGRGRGCGRKNFPQKRFEQDKKTFLLQRIQILEEKMTKENIPKDRLEIMSKRLEKLKLKQAKFIGETVDVVPNSESSTLRDQLFQKRKEKKELNKQLFRTARDLGEEEDIKRLKEIIDEKKKEIRLLKQTNRKVSPQ